MNIKCATASQSSLQVPIPSITTKALFPMYMYLLPFEIQQKSTQVVKSLAITSKVTRFTTIKTIHILIFFTTAFLMLVLMSIIICFYSSLTIFETLTLSLFKFRAKCSSHLNLTYKSLIYRLLSEESIFFKLNMTSNIIKCLHVVIVGKVDKYVFSIALLIADHNSNLLFISLLMSNIF